MPYVSVLTMSLGPIHTKSIMDSRDAAYLLGLQPSSIVRNYVIRLV
jgi:hypothetical protein